MSSSLAGRRSSPPAANLDIDNYDVDDDPFASEPEDNQKNTTSKKRKDVDGLGLDEEVAVAKKARVPNVKLDETRLLSEKGIPRLRRKAGDLKFKGKGHEFSDTARLLSFYQLWLDDLFPKARFIDALSMVEKAGHKKFLQAKRVEWINEGKPQASRAEDVDLFGANSGGVEDEQREATVFPARIAPIFKNRGSERPRTPAEADVPDEDEDLYGATPKASKQVQGERARNAGLGLEDDNDDDLDAFMAEEEAQRTSSTSLFGNGGGGTSALARTYMPDDDDDDDDLDALMAEAETSGSLPVRQAPKNNPQRADAEEDDLDAMMADPGTQGSAGADNDRKPAAGSTVADGADADEEAAMAEMDGLW